MKQKLKHACDVIVRGWDLVKDRTEDKSRMHLNYTFNNSSIISRKKLVQNRLRNENKRSTFETSVDT